MRNKGALIFWGVVILIGIGVASFFGIRYMIRSNTVAPFNKQINNYLSGGVPPAGGNPNDPNQRQKVKGKILPVDVEKKEVDWVYFDLPDEVRPAKPEDIGAVALLRWGKNLVGNYNNNPSNPAYQQTVQVTVVDQNTKTILGQTSFAGSMPPQKKKSSESGTGSRPDAEIINYLKGFPR
jgi:hypothetical protein